MKNKNTDTDFYMPHSGIQQFGNIFTCSTPCKSVVDLGGAKGPWLTWP